MIFKQSWLHITDNTNVSWLQVFHLYKGFHRKTSFIGYFIKGTARIIEPPRIEYKGFKVKYNKKGDICRALLIRTVYMLKRKDRSVIYFSQNNALLIKKKQDLKSKYVYGPATKLLKRKRFLTAFRRII
jgi:large subunit ribosomal protein L14